jgi:SM-20-related protein
VDRGSVIKLTIEAATPHQPSQKSHVRRIIQATFRASGLDQPVHGGDLKMQADIRESPKSAVITVGEWLGIGRKASIRSEYFTGEIEHAPYMRIPKFLKQDENKFVLDYASSRRSSFDLSRVETGVPDHRHSHVLFDLRELNIDLEGRIWEILPDVISYLGIKIPAACRLETQLTTHNDGGYFKAHNDNGSPGTADRFLTYVYYFHHEPAAFAGGELRLYDSKVEANQWVAVETFAEIKPENNMLLLFPSRLFHEVMPIGCDSRDFADGRFTLNGWVREVNPVVL